MKTMWTPEMITSMGMSMARNHSQINQISMQVSKTNPYQHRNMADLPHFAEFAREGRVIEEVITRQQKDLEVTKRGLREGGEQMAKLST